MHYQIKQSLVTCGYFDLHKRKEIFSSSPQLVLFQSLNRRPILTVTSSPSFSVHDAHHLSFSSFWSADFRSVRKFTGNFLSQPLHFSCNYLCSTHIPQLHFLGIIRPSRARTLIGWSFSTQDETFSSVVVWWFEPFFKIRT